MIENVVAQPKERQLKDLTHIIVQKLGDMTPISHQDITKYVTRIFEDLSKDQVRNVLNNELLYIQKIKENVKELEGIYAREQFEKLLQTNQIFVKPSFKFKSALVHLSTSVVIEKSLYDREASMNAFEQKVIMDIASLDSVLFCIVT